MPEIVLPQSATWVRCKNICLSYRDNCRRRSLARARARARPRAQARAKAQAKIVQEEDRLGRAKRRKKETKINNTANVCRSPLSWEFKSATEMTVDEDQSVPRWWVQVYWRGACANGCMGRPQQLGPGNSNGNGNGNLWPAAPKMWACDT